MTHFDYKLLPLDEGRNEVRLVDLLPEKPVVTEHENLILACEMRVVSLDDSPKYAALSYTWGDPLDASTQEITKAKSDHVDDAISGESENNSTHKEIEVRNIRVNGAILGVSEYLFQALSHLRSDKPLALWVDALSIDQDCEEEKSSQVQRMSRVYQAAERVPVWLGPATEDSDRAMDTIARLGEAARELGVLELRHGKLHTPTSPEYARQTEIMRAVVSMARDTAIDGDDYVAICRLSKRRWWFRLWVMQELALSRSAEFICGAKRVAFEPFAVAIIFLATWLVERINRITIEDIQDPVQGPELKKFLKQTVEGQVSRKLGARSRTLQPESGSPEILAKLLIQAHSFHSSNIRLETTETHDKIYSLLGMASDADLLGIRTDYSLSKQQVFINAAKAMLLNGQVDILAMCQFPHNMAGLPSWTPDWTGHLQTPCGSCSWDKPPLFRAGGDTAPSVSAKRSSGGEDGLILQCAKFDTIKQLGPPWTPALSGFDWVQAVHHLVAIKDFCNTAISLRPDVPGLYEAYWRVPVADQHPAEGSNIRQRATERIKRGHELICEASWDVSKWQTAVPDEQMANYQIYMCYQHKRRAFLSDAGHVGLVPLASEVGDEIHVVPGASVPYVLRLAGAVGEEGHRQGVLVGEAYVYGIMDGEFMETGPTLEVCCLE